MGRVKGETDVEVHRLTLGNHCQHKAGVVGRESALGVQWEPELWRKVCTADAPQQMLLKEGHTCAKVGWEWQVAGGGEYSEPLLFPHSDFWAIFPFTKLNQKPGRKEFRCCSWWDSAFWQEENISRGRANVAVHPSWKNVPRMGY